MRRILLMAAAASTLALGVTGVASASEHHHHHAQHRRRHHEHMRTVLIGAAQGLPSVPPVSGAAKVSSFTAGKLTITLADGTMLSGRVSEATEIRCEAADRPPMIVDQDGDSRGGPGPGAQGNRDEVDNDQGDDNDRGNDNDQGDDNDQGNDNDHGVAERCTVAALIPGAVVSEAELRVGAAGAVWEELELVA
jgi:hypothetical protein